MSLAEYLNDQPILYQVWDEEQRSWREAQMAPGQCRARLKDSVSFEATVDCGFSTSACKELLPYGANRSLDPKCISFPEGTGQWSTATGAAIIVSRPQDLITWTLDFNKPTPGVVFTQRFTTSALFPQTVLSYDQNQTLTPDALQKMRQSCSDPEPPLGWPCQVPGVDEDGFCARVPLPACQKWPTQVEQMQAAGHPCRHPVSGMCRD